LKTYVCGSELLLCADDGAGSLGCVQGRVSLDHGLALGLAWATSLASDLGDSVPVRHGECV